jgi:cytochrome c556
MAGQLQQAALQLRQSLQEDDPAAARNAHGAMKQSCVACHQLYRE